MERPSSERDETIAGQIKLARRLTTMNQFQFAKAVGITSHDRVSKLERGLVRPRASEIDAVVRFLHERGHGTTK